VETVKNSVPMEIVKFFENAGNSALLIKGDPGAGKTIFSLNFLANQCKEGCGIYFSTRVDSNSIYGQFPWIKEKIPPENIVDATQSMVPKRLEVPQLIRYSSLPDFLKGLYTILEERKPIGTPTVVVDSIDAVANSIGLSIEETCSRIIDTVRSTNIKAIIVTERSEKTALDYICDGVITLKRKLIEGRIFREMIIEKLRGVQIINPTYYYTLYGGQFQFFKPFPILRLYKKKYAPHPVIKDGKGTKYYGKDLFSTSYQQLDEIIQGVKRGSFFLIESVGEVPCEFAFELVGSPIENFAMQKRGVVIVPCKGINPLWVFDIFSKFIGENVFKEHCKVIDFRRMKDGKQFPWLVKTNGSVDKFIEHLNNAIDNLKEKTNENILVVLSFGILEALFGPEEAEKIASEIASRIKFEKDLLIGTTFSGMKAVEKIREIADYVFRIFCEKDVLFGYGVHPPTEINNINIDLSKPHPQIYFIPVT